MTKIYLIIKLIIQAAMLIPVIERLIKEALDAHYKRKLKKDIVEAVEEAKETQDTSKLEKLLGKKI